MLDVCEPLKEYAQFIADFRYALADGSNEEAAISRSIERLPTDSKLRKFLLAHKAEVKRMCITEYDEARTMELFKEEGREEGREETQVSNIRALMQRLKLSAEAAMDALAVPPEEQKKYAMLLKETETAGNYTAIEPEP